MIHLKIHALVICTFIIYNLKKKTSGCKKEPERNYGKLYLLAKISLRNVSKQGQTIFVQSKERVDSVKPI